MGWFNNRLMRGASNRAYRRLAAEFGVSPTTGVLALALGHACYPTAIYGDKGLQEYIVQQLKQFALRPCDAQTARKHVEDWLDKGMLSTESVFLNVWGMDPLQFLLRFFKTCADES